MLANCTLADRQHDSKSIQESSDKSETVHSTAIVQFFEKRLYVDVDVDIDLICIFMPLLPTKYFSCSILGHLAYRFEWYHVSE